MSKSSKMKDKVVAKAVGNLEHCDIMEANNSFSSFCSTSTKSFSADSLETSQVPENLDRNFALEVIEDELSSMYKKKTRRCRTPETMMASMRMTPDLEEAKEDEFRRRRPRQSCGRNSDSERTSGSEMKFELNFNREPRVDGKRRSPSPKVKDSEKKASPKKKSPMEDVHVVHFANPFETADARKTTGKRPVNSKVRPDVKVAPLHRQPSKTSLKTGSEKTRKKVSGDPKNCPAAALLAQIKNNQIQFPESNRSNKKKPIQKEKPKEGLKSTGSTKWQSKKSENVTEVELFMPQLKLKNGHIVFDCIKKPIIKKKTPPTDKKSPTPKKKDALTKEEELVFPAVQATVTKINEVLTSTIRELKQKIDDILPGGKTTPTIGNSSDVSGGLPQANETKYGRNLQKSQRTVAANANETLSAETNETKGIQNKKPSASKVEIVQDSGHSPKQKRRQPLSPVVLPAVKTTKNHNKKHPPTVREMNQGILEGKFDVKKVKEILLSPPSYKCTSNMGRSWSWYLETRLPGHGKSYKEMYLENIVGKENAVKCSREHHQLSNSNEKPVESQNLALGTDKNNLKYCSKVKDESWIHRHFRLPNQSTKIDATKEILSDSIAGKKSPKFSGISGKGVSLRRGANKKAPSHTLKPSLV